MEIKEQIDEGSIMVLVILLITPDVSIKQQLELLKKI